MKNISKEICKILEYSFRQDFRIILQATIYKPLWQLLISNMHHDAYYSTVKGIVYNFKLIQDNYIGK